MGNNLGLKLIAVMDLNKLRLYEAQGLRINKKIEELPLAIHKEHRHQHGQYQTGAGSISSFEPHTSEKNLEHQETAKIITKHLDKVMSSNAEYKELMIAAEPKTLGFVRQYLSKNLQKLVTKEIVKDLVHKNMSEIEKVFFS